MFQKMRRTLYGKVGLSQNVCNLYKFELENID